mgnify:CR=1 FL=1
MSCDCAAIAQLVERILGKDEVSSSNLDSSSSSNRLDGKPSGRFFVSIALPSGSSASLAAPVRGAGAERLRGPSNNKAAGLLKACGFVVMGKR